MRPAILRLTYFFDPEGQEAYARLKREASRFGDVFQVWQGAGRPADRIPRERDVVDLSDDEVRAALPRRARQAWMIGGRLDGGFTDCLHMAAMRRFYGYPQVWLIEYDVDFSGDWGGFFAEFADVRADLLGTTLYPRRRCLQWANWLLFGGPPDALPDGEMRGFFPVVRLSRRFAAVYSHQVATDWTGHFEALYPTIARNGGLSIEDIGGTGPLTPDGRRGRLYTNSDDPALGDGTFRFRPAVSDHYFPHARVQRPGNHLWHPVKTGAYRDARHRAPVQATENPSP